jgi:hypothetical protein
LGGGVIVFFPILLDGGSAIGTHLYIKGCRVQVKEKYRTYRTKGIGMMARATVKIQKKQKQKETKRVQGSVSIKG